MSAKKSDPSRPHGILFLGLANNRRTLIAEALFRDRGARGMRAYSAGLEPVEHADPYALSALSLAGVGCDDLRPKHWASFADTQEPLVDTVVVIGDIADQVEEAKFPVGTDFIHWTMREEEDPSQMHRGIWRDIKLIRPLIDDLVEALRTKASVRDSIAAE